MTPTEYIKHCLERNQMLVKSIIGTSSKEVILTGSEDITGFELFDHNGGICLLKKGIPNWEIIEGRDKPEIVTENA